MLDRVARRGLALLDRPLDALVESTAGPRIVIVIYHRVGLRSPSAVDLTSDRFMAQLEQIDPVRVLSLDDAIGVLDGSRRPPSNDPGVVLTFDDGTVDWHDVVLPILDHRGLPATFYVSTDFIERQRPFPDGGRPAAWSGLAEIVAHPRMTIGSHTHTHRVMAGLDAQQAQEEVDRAIDLIEDRLGVTPIHFAYPKAVAPSPAAEVVVRRRHASAVLAGNRVARPGRTDLHRIGRHALTVADDDESFQRKIAGGMLLEGWLREQRDAWQVRRAGPS